ncbi:hypothetical protein PG993_005630 [Apiospora rasikravindrae]|uniref:Uncharacterized protein n=1 Tax=Apiospora rasikravindrae TaxID=990691 RepID=A0ABR1TI11_9PEZI
MGHRSKFTFPVPGRKPKPSPPSTKAGPALTKAERILGTGGINVDSPSNSMRSPPQPWDAKSGISISVSESSDGYATVQTGLGIRTDDEYDDNATAGTSYGQQQNVPCPWDLESDIIPRQLRTAQGNDHANQLRQQKSAATIGHHYRDGTTTASTAMRRQSNASTIFTHYDPHQVPLSISQQTSSSAMAKGLPTKITDLVDVDGLLNGKQDKKKPAKLDLSLLRPKNTRSNKDVSPQQAEPVLGNNYVMRSPSFVSQTSSVKNSFEMPPHLGGFGSKRASRKMNKLPPGSNNQSNDTLPSLGKMSELNQLYDHYERQLFGQEDEEEENDEESSSPLLEFPMPPMNDHRFSSEPSPPLTTASTHMSSFVTPLSNPVTRQAAYQPQQPYRNRKDSTTSSRRTTTAISPPHSHLHNAQEDAASISSRNTGKSKVSQQKSPLDTDLQQRSVLSLSDSESDDETFSDSAPMSSMSSHGQTSHGSSPASDYRKRPDQQQTISAASAPQNHHNNHNTVADSKSKAYNRLSDFLTVPNPSSPGQHASPRSSPAVSQTTLRSASSSSTTTGLSKSGSGYPSDRSARSSATADSLTRAKTARQPQDAYGVHEAKVIAILPVASTVDAASMSGMPESDYHASEYDPRFSRQRNSDQPTPPLSPTSVDFYIQSPPKSIDRSSVSVADATEAHNARFMAVTRQEEMLLAALRKKRAIMRENNLAEAGGEKGGSVAGSLNEERSNNGSSSSSSGSRSSRQFEKGTSTSSHGRKLSSESMPRNTIVFPGRSSSLARNMKDLTADREREGRSGSALSQHRTGPASKSAMRAASSSRLASANSAHARDDSDDRHHRLSGSYVSGGPQAPGQHDRRERVLMFLDRPLGGLDSVDSAEPSPDLSEFLDFDMVSEMGGGHGHGEDRRRSRARSRYNTSGSGSHGYGHSSSSHNNNNNKNNNNTSDSINYHRRKPSNRPRADSNALNPMTSPLRIRLDGVPEREFRDENGFDVDDLDVDEDEDDYLEDDHFDGFSDVMQHPTMTSTSSRRPAVARDESPVRPRQGSGMLMGHIKGKNSAIRISAVGPSWGDDD